MPIAEFSHYNYTIIGAGASGLWMAYALYKQGLLKDQSLCIVESDTNKVNDRTWCYWAKEELLPLNMASKSWSHTTINSNSLISKSIYPYNYYHIRSEDFYLSIKKELQNCKQITWVDSVFKSFDKPNRIVKTINQDWLTDRLFLSALAPDHANSENDGFHLNNLKEHSRINYKKQIFLWQSFIGWRVETTKPIFNDLTMSIMNFHVPQDGNTQFIYELPFSKTEALIEITRFGKNKLNEADAKTILTNYLSKKETTYVIKEVENGAIPMTTLFDIRKKELPADESVIYLGTLAGAIKPTSGYGFRRMNNYAKEVALALAENKNLPTMYRKWRFRFYDILLLQILESRPEEGKRIFEELFNNQPVNRILKFLDEETNIVEEIKIFSRLPIFLFLQSLIKFII